MWMHLERPTPNEPTRPLTLRKTEKVEVEDVSSALAAAEYMSVRAESLQSFITSQSIIQWSLATYGVLFGAGLLATGNAIAKDLKVDLFWMAALIYGLLLPGLVCAAAWSWIGEIRRMERTGVYLRGVERRLREETETSSSAIIGPLNWEHFLTGDLAKNAPPAKGLAPYLGTAMLFGGSIIASVCFFYIWVEKLLEENQWMLGIWLLVAFNSILFILFFAVCVFSGVDVLALGRKYFDQRSRKLEWFGRPIDTQKVSSFTFAAIVLVGALFAVVLLPDSILSWRGDVFPWAQKVHEWGLPDLG